MEPEANAEAMGNLTLITNAIEWPMPLSDQWVSWPSMANASLAIVDADADVATVSWCWQIPSMEFSIREELSRKIPRLLMLKAALPNHKKLVDALVGWLVNAMGGLAITTNALE